MQRVLREITDVEMIDALNEIIDLIIDCYDSPVRKEHEQDFRSTQIGHDIVKVLTKRDLIWIWTKVGYDSQRILTDRKILKTGGIEGIHGEDTKKAEQENREK